MTSAVLHRDTLIPRPPAGMGPGLLLALLVHGALILAIAYGVRWHASEPEGIEAELWAAVPQMAAPPPAVQPPPAPQRAPKPTPPAPAPRVQPEPDAQIAIEKARREEAERRRKDEAEKLAEKRQKEEAEKRKQEQAEKLAEKRKREQEEERRLEREEQQRAELRRKNLERMMAQAGNGAPSSTGAAERSAGPSAGYAGRIKARIKPNIVFTDTPSGNPVAEVEVRLAPDGTIVGQRLTKSSGLPEWDEAVQRAIERTQVLPRDIDGRVPPTMVIAFRPHD